MKLKFSLITTTTVLFSVTGCTVYLPPTEEPIPSADPILVPGKATTVKPNRSPTKNETKASTTAGTVKEKKATPKPKTPESSQGTSRQGQTFYIVKPKDTVFAVMRKTGVHWQEIIKLNNLKAPKYTIFPGQNLRIK
ncbi:MAG: LysM peptidoglycan-binding domain-containing protein [Thiotrichaceae bacterium]